MFHTYMRCLLYYNLKKKKKVIYLCAFYRAKLAEWLASKGKALKRPAMSTAKPSKTNVSTKPVVKLQSQPAARHMPEPRLEMYNADTAVGTVSCGDTQRAGPTASSQTPVIMNTTLDLETSDGDLSAESQDRVDDVSRNGAWFHPLISSIKMYNIEHQRSPFVL